MVLTIGLLSVPAFAETTYPYSRSYGSSSVNTSITSNGSGEISNYIYSFTNRKAISAIDELSVRIENAAAGDLMYFLTPDTMCEIFIRFTDKLPCKVAAFVFWAALCAGIILLRAGIQRARTDCAE